jgi:hypothetical protein
VSLEERTTKGFCPEGLQVFEKISAEMYNCIHTDNGTNLHTRVRVRVASCFEYFTSVSMDAHERFGRCQGNDFSFPLRHPKGNEVRTSPLPRVTPCTESTREMITPSYLAYQPHFWHVVYTGGYSNLLSHAWFLLTPQATSLEIPHSQ